MRLENRFIPRDWIIDSAGNYEIIEIYEQDYPLPSFLIRSYYNETVIHIVIAVDKGSEYITIVTAYKPSPEKWDIECRTRKSHDLS